MGSKPQRFLTQLQRAVGQNSEHSLTGATTASPRPMNGQRGRTGWAGSRTGKYVAFHHQNILNGMAPIQGMGEIIPESQAFQKPHESWSHTH